MRVWVRIYHSWAHHQRDVGSNNWIQRPFLFYENKSLNPLRMPASVETDLR